MDEAPGSIAKEVGSSRGLSPLAASLCRIMALKGCKTSRAGKQPIYTKATDKRI